MDSLRKVKIIAVSTFMECIRDRIMYLFVLVSIFLIILSYITSEFTYGYPSRVALHFGLTAISICSISISVFIGVGLVTGEIEKRSIHTIISKPVSRHRRRSSSGTPRPWTTGAGMTSPFPPISSLTSTGETWIWVAKSGYFCPSFGSQR